HAWRDPFLFREQDYVYMMLSAKSIENSLGRNGVVGLLRTKTENFAQVIQGEEEWEYLKPLSKPGYYSEMEVSQLYKDLQGNYELVFSTWAKYDFSPTTRNAGGLQGVTIPQSWNFNNCHDRSIESIDSNTDFHVLMPEISGLYACRIIPELDGEVVGFDTEHGGIRRSGVKTKFEQVNRDFSEFSLRIA
ncbi:MAG: beta-fructosidase, partial [Cyanobacteria bacterium P01_A01_bin.40]